MATNFFDNFVCIEGCVTSSIDICVYAWALCYFISKAGKDKFGTGTILMLLVPMMEYSSCVIGRITDYLYRAENYCSIYEFKHWYDWI
jgi:hypothetical protein